MSERNRVIDIAKGLCMLLVVTGHYFPDDAPEWYALMRQWIYTFHMPLFMFLSGYIYFRFGRTSGYFDFILTKSKRLLVPYLFVSILLISLKLIMGGDPSLENPVTISSYLTMFYTPSAGYFLWFILSLMTIFIIVPLFRGRKAMGVLLLLAVILHYVDFPFEFPTVFALNETKRMLLWFVLGCVSADIPENAGRLLSGDFARYSAVVLFAVLSVIYFISGNGSVAAAFLPYAGIMAVISLSCFLDRSKWKRPGRAACVLGGSSYVIYLLHTTFMGIAKSLVYRLHVFPDGDAGFVICALTVIAIGIVFPLLADRYVISKSPVLKFLMGCGGKHSAGERSA